MWLVWASFKEHVCQSNNIFVLKFHAMLEV